MNQYDQVQGRLKKSRIMFEELARAQDEAALDNMEDVAMFACIIIPHHKLILFYLIPLL